jgi:hypothetical protein
LKIKKEIKSEVKELYLLPCAKDKCKECAVNHGPDEPHNATSLYYHFKFHKENGRCPTWKDALAHCRPEIQKAWEDELRKRGKWTE